MTTTVEQWAVFELPLTSDQPYENPLQDVLLVATFVSDAGEVRRVDAFWDGGQSWRVRFAPPTLGRWRYTTECNDPRNLGLHGITGVFTCVESSGGTRFQEHGPVKVADDGRYLAHADGTPFFYLADTCWNGPLLSDDDEWRQYVETRTEQGFTAVQWVVAQWISAPDGDRDGRLPFSGSERISIDPAVFQRLDGKFQAMTDAGLLSVPVLLWAAEWGAFDVMKVNPGLTLPEDQSILLARYIVARWGAYPVLWILPGDSEYRGPRAERWKRIGRGVFAGREHAPVSLHPNGMSWHADEFRDEPWLSLYGYQGCHFGDDNAYVWAIYGPPASEWHLDARPIINLEPPYEHHIHIGGTERFSAADVRRAIYWSLLVSPTAGVTYGGHGVWGWDDGTRPPTAHEASGIPLPWQEALHMEAGEQIRHVEALFEALPWWTLRPDTAMVTEQPSDVDIKRHIAAARSADGDLAVVYVPEDRRVTLDLSALQAGLTAEWFNPRTGEQQPASASGESYETPAEGDWVLLFS